MLQQGAYYFPLYVCVDSVRPLPSPPAVFSFFFCQSPSMLRRGQLVLATCLVVAVGGVIYITDQQRVEKEVRRKYRGDNTRTRGRGTLRESSRGAAAKLSIGRRCL
jgi:hypothetical protein